MKITYASGYLRKGKIVGEGGGSWREGYLWEGLQEGGLLVGGAAGGRATCGRGCRREGYLWEGLQEGGLLVGGAAGGRATCGRGCRRG